MRGAVAIEWAIDAVAADDDAFTRAGQAEDAVAADVDFTDTIAADVDPTVAVVDVEGAAAKVEVTVAGGTGADE